MHQINPNDLQVVLWTMWDGLTALAAGHMEYSTFDHNGQSGGSHHPFKPRSEAHLFGVRMGWWEPGAEDHVIYAPATLQFVAAKTIADAIPN